MNRFGTFLCVMLLCLLLTSTAKADGTVSWTSGYPAAGSMAGQIKVKGSATADTGYTLTSATVKYWESACGGVEKTMTLTLGMGGSFGESTITGLTTGTAYCIVVEVVETNGCGGTQTLTTSGATVTAP